MPPKRKRASTIIENPEEVVVARIVTESEILEPTVRRVSKRTKKVISYVESAPAEESIADNDYESPLTDLDELGQNEDLEKSAPKKRKRRQKITEPVIYEIPPVESKETNFKGRLGYACLNTVLRALKPDPIFCSRTCRKDTITKNGLDFAKDLGRQNCKDLCKLIEWNEENNIKFLRLSSEMFPFASHGELGYSLEYAAEELKAAGDLAKKYGHRLTAHPGQFTQLGSPREAVVTASVRELEYHCQMMRYMGLDKDSVMIIHMGGVYGNKEETIARFKENYQTRLTDEMKARLVLENDEICYSVDDLLPVCSELDIPIVLDYHHNWIKPSEKPLSEIIPLINAIWHCKGIKPKQHLSSPRPGAESVMEKRAHADRCYELPPDLPEDMDLMIEAKDKEQAVLHLYRIYNLHPVIHNNLRPEKPPKPFVRDNVTDEVDGMGDGEEEGIAVEATKPKSPRKRKARGGALKANDTKETLESTVSNAEKKSKKKVDGRPSSDIANVSTERGTTNPEVPTTSKKSRAKKSKKNTAVKPPATDDSQLAMKLVNQEECISPMDGAEVENVEEDEHPEVISATEEDNKPMQIRKPKRNRRDVMKVV